MHLCESPGGHTHCKSKSHLIERINRMPKVGGVMAMSHGSSELQRLIRVEGYLNGRSLVALSLALDSSV